MRRLAAQVFAQFPAQFLAPFVAPFLAPFLALFLALVVAAPATGARQDLSRDGAPASRTPTLVLLVVIDQFRADYLTRWESEYTGGFARLLADGAVFTNAFIEHYPTVTAIAHATVLSGALPSASGIVGNDWFDRTTGEQVTSVSDETLALVGAEGSAASPHRLLVSTIGDELKVAASPEGAEPRVIGMSLKDRGAILPVGRAADAAYWLDTSSGRFVTSTHYVEALPTWVTAFNDARGIDRFTGATWDAPGTNGQTLPDIAGESLYEAVYASPYGNDLLADFAVQALVSEELGRRGTTDLLSVSFSSNDAVGHQYGPDSSEVHDISLRTDAALERLLDRVDELIGLEHVLVVVTSDHGVAPVPEEPSVEKWPGGRMTSADLFDPIQKALEARFGPGDWIEATAGSSPYLNEALMRERDLDPVDVRAVAAEGARTVPHVARVFTRDQLLRGDAPPDLFSQRVARSFNDQRSGDLEILLEPYWMRSASGTTHGTPYAYDAQIPLVFMGPGIRPGRYDGTTALNDVAPTLATRLRLAIPSGSVGRVLTEMLEATP